MMATTTGAPACSGAPPACNAARARPLSMRCCMQRRASCRRAALMPEGVARPALPQAKPAFPSSPSQPHLAAARGGEPLSPGRLLCGALGLLRAGPRCRQALRRRLLWPARLGAGRRPGRAALRGAACSFVPQLCLARGLRRLQLLRRLGLPVGDVIVLLLAFLLLAPALCAGGAPGRPRLVARARAAALALAGVVPAGGVRRAAAAAARPSVVLPRAAAIAGAAAVCPVDVPAATNVGGGGALSAGRRGLLEPWGRGAGQAPAGGSCPQSEKRPGPSRMPAPGRGPAAGLPL